MTGASSATALGRTARYERDDQGLCPTPGASRPKTVHWPQRSKRVMLDLESDHSNERSGSIRYTRVSLQQTRPGYSMSENCYLVIARIPSSISENVWPNLPLLFSSDINYPRKSRGKKSTTPRSTQPSLRPLIAYQVSGNWEPHSRNSSHDKLCARSPHGLAALNLS